MWSCLILGVAMGVASIQGADVLVRHADGQELLVVRFAAASPGAPFSVALTLPAGATPVAVEADVFEALAAVIDPPPVDVDPRPRARIARPLGAAPARPAPTPPGRLGRERLLPGPVVAGLATTTVQVEPIAAAGFIGPFAWSFPAAQPVLPALPVPPGAPVLVFAQAEGPVGLGGQALRQLPRAELDRRAQAPRPVRLFAGTWATLEADHRWTALDERAIPAAEVPALLGAGVVSVLWGAPAGGALEPLVLPKKLNRSEVFDVQQRGPRDDRGALRLEGELPAPEAP
ncbi:MAG: hypothetical protein H6706_29985 [Myxococcales bacterium]|nr:hypothetical protein [Myxococcales bacterium]